MVHACLENPLFWDTISWKQFAAAGRVSPFTVQMQLGPTAPLRVLYLLFSFSYAIIIIFLFLFLQNVIVYVNMHIHTYAFLQLYAILLNYPLNWNKYVSLKYRF